MNSFESEKILCVARDALPQQWLSEAVAIKTSWKEFVALISSTALPIFLDRMLLESDKAYKQIIPYILLRDKSGRMAIYQRHGSEKRLNGCFSLGVGGHIRQEDFSNGCFSWEEIASKAILRELEEELPGFESRQPPAFLGLINEEKTSVGHVHIGLVFIFDNLDAVKIIPGEELSTLKWVFPESLSDKALKLELWSTLALSLSHKEATPPPQL